MNLRVNGANVAATKVIDFTGTVKNEREQSFTDSEQKASNTSSTKKVILSGLAMTGVIGATLLGLRMHNNVSFSKLCQSIIDNKNWHKSLETFENNKRIDEKIKAEGFRLPDCKKFTSYEEFINYINMDADKPLMRCGGKYAKIPDAPDAGKYYALDKEADLVSAGQRVTYGPSSSGSSTFAVKHDGTLRGLNGTLYDNCLTESDFVSWPKLREACKDKVILSRNLAREGHEPEKETLSVFKFNGRTYVRHSIEFTDTVGNKEVAILIPSCTEGMSPFQKDFVDAIKQGYLPKDYNLKSWGSDDGNLEFGRLAKEVYEFVHKSAS